MSDNEYITIDEARAILRVTARQVYRLAAEGKIATLQTKGARLYLRGDVQRIAQERGVEREAAIVVQGVSDLAQSRQMVELLRQHSEVLTRLDQRPADPALLERLDRIEAAIGDQSQRPAVPRWFWAVIAMSVIVAATALVIIALRPF